MAQQIYGETDRTRGVLDYSTSQTETDFTLTVRTRMQAKSYGYSGYRVNTKLAGTTVSTKLDYVHGVYTSFTDAMDTGNYSKTYTRTHAAQSVVIKSEYYGEGTGDYYAGSKSGDTSVTVSIPAKSSYTVSYNANGGSGAPSSQTKWYGESLTLSSTKPTRTNYVFLGWSTSSTATSATYASGGSYTANAGATLYAVWKLNAYTVTYNKGANGTGTNTTDTKIHGDNTFKLRGAIFTRTGYTQTGWATSDGGAQAYALSASYTANAAITLYPVWTINSWTVSYNLNGGSGTFNSQTKYYNTTLTLRTESPTKASASVGSYTISYNGNGGTAGTTSATAARTTSYTFSKWNTAQNGSGTNYSSGGSYTANAGATLYAQYAGSTSTASVTLPSNATRTGYTFAGWYTAASGGTKVGNAGASYTPTGTITLYAQWTPVTYTISYSASGASNVPSSQSQTRDQYMTVTSQKPTKTDYVFNGWDTSSSATTVRVTPGQKYMPNANTTLYAVFTLNYSEPKITNVTAVRCNSSGTSQDDGTYVKVGCSWSTFSTNYKATKIEIFYKRTNASSWTTGYTNSNPNAYSGTLSQVIGGGNINAEYTYSIQIKVTDSVDNGTYTTFVSSAFFAIDQGTAGKSLGFGMSALDSDIPSNGRADFGMDAHFNAKVYLKDGSLLQNSLYQSTGYENLNTAGWYRIYKQTASPIGYRGFSVDIAINTRGNYVTSKKITLMGVYDKFLFTDETSLSTSSPISKIRYVTNSDNSEGYIDIYYSLNTSNRVEADFIFRPIYVGDSEYSTPIDYISVASAPSETVKAEYTFTSNYNVNDNTMYKSGETESFSYVMLHGASYSASKRLVFEINTSKRMDRVSAPSISALTGLLSGVNGTAEGSSLSTNWISSAYTISTWQANATTVMIQIDKATEYTNITSSTPVVLYAATLTLQF